MGEEVDCRIYMGESSAGLERTPDKREVGGSSPLKPIAWQRVNPAVKINRIQGLPQKRGGPHPWGCSSVGRAPALQAGGQEFESLHLHSPKAT